MARWFFLCFLLLPSALNADDVFLYSSSNRIFGVNLDRGEEVLVTTASLSPTVNALAVNSISGLVYYGDDTSIYYWDVALGTGPNSHALINNFENGFFQAPIHNINSTGGSFLNGSYFIGSEDDRGFIEELYELKMSSDGRQIVSVQALNLQLACACNKFQLGGFGDIAVIDSPGGPIIYGSSTDLTRNGQGTHAGIWRFELASNNWTLLADGVGGQLAASLDGRILTNIGNSVRELNIANGAVSRRSLFTTNSAIWDFTGYFSFDFGDAPDSYGGALHFVGGENQGVYIGKTPADNESFSQNGAGGGASLGDDSNGIDDEDALTTEPILNLSDSDYALNIDCSSGYVAAWIDFNMNGQFDFVERSENYPVRCTAGKATLTWSGFTVASAGDSYLRIRASAQAGEIYKPTGRAGSGEVEDYKVSFNEMPIASGSCPTGSISHIYKARDVPKSYSGVSLVSSVINVPDSLTITDINVLNFNATHQTQRQLNFYLRKDNTRRRLYGNNCRANQGFFLNFDDQAGSAVCPPESGASYRPRQTLSSFNGRDAMGDWLLEVRNRRRDNQGKINSWALEVCAIGVDKPVPDIRLGKVADVSGRFVTMTLVLRNTGDTQLDSVNLVDNLDTVFGIGNYAVSGAPEILSAPAGFVANQNYSGQSGSDGLLSSSGSLQVGEEIKLQFSVRVALAGNQADSNYLNQAYVKAASPDSGSVEDLSSIGLDLSVDQDIPTPISLSNTVRIGGLVFTDTSANPETSHDGIQQQNEAGEAGRTVKIIDPGTGNEIAAAVTLANGSWSVQLDVTYINQPITVMVVPIAARQFISESPLNTDSSNSDGQITQLVLADASLNQTRIGVIAHPSLTLDQSSSIAAGGSTLYSHVYRAPTHGVLKLGLQGINSVPTSNWSYSLHHDLDCDSQLGNSDYAINAVLDVVHQQQLCLLVELSSSVSAANGDFLTLDLSSVLLPADLASISHNVQFDNRNQDITRILSNDAGNLVLKKSVSNLTLGEGASDRNKALPGHLLEYTIAYSNSGSGNVNDLVINDQSPAFTLIETGSAECVQTPAPLNCVPNISGAELQWVFQGVLPPGANGQVRYRIRVE